VRPQGSFGGPCQTEGARHNDRKMLKYGILNPALASLLCRFRHTNWIVIADRGFPFWPGLETVDISLTDNIPTVRQVLAALRDGYGIGAALMAEEIRGKNEPKVLADYQSLLPSAQIEFLPHTEFKKRVPSAIGLIRTGDTTQYGNILVQSA
jgi:D-ribose pyranase